MPPNITLLLGSLIIITLCPKETFAEDSITFEWGDYDERGFSERLKLTLLEPAAKIEWTRMKESKTDREIKIPVKTFQTSCSESETDILKTLHRLYQYCHGGFSGSVASYSGWSSTLVKTTGNTDLQLSGQGGNENHDLGSFATRVHSWFKLSEEDSKWNELDRDLFFSKLAELSQMLTRYANAMALIEQGFANGKPADWQRILSEAIQIYRPKIWAYDKDDQDMTDAGLITPVNQVLDSMTQSIAEGKIPAFNAKLRCCYRIDEVVFDDESDLFIWGSPVPTLKSHNGNWAYLPNQLRFCLEDFVFDPYSIGEKQPHAYLDIFPLEHGKGKQWKDKTKYLDSHSGLFAFLFSEPEVARQQIQFIRLRTIQFNPEKTLALAMYLDNKRGYTVSAFKKSGDDWAHSISVKIEQWMRSLHNPNRSEI